MIIIIKMFDNNGVIELSVDGVKYTTTRAALTGDRDRILYRMFADDLNLHL
jgi:hypothetical protein